MRAQACPTGLSGAGHVASIPSRSRGAAAPNAEISRRGDRHCRRTFSLQNLRTPGPTLCGFHKSAPQRGASQACAASVRSYGVPERPGGEDDVKPAPCPAVPCWADKFLRIPDGGLLVVPWGMKTVVTVMVAWFISFLVVGHVGLPALASIFGLNRLSLTDRGMAVYSLITDVIEMIVGLGVVRFMLRPFHPLPAGWFPFKPSGGFLWLRDVGIASLAFPLVSGLSRLSTDIIPFLGETGGIWEQSVEATDPVASFLYVMVVSVFAPVWEEVIFRGFLLPSLVRDEICCAARYLSMDKAIFASAVVFAAAHSSLERLLPLTLLGIVMGALYVRSRTLLAPMLLHSLWNGYAFLEILVFK